MSSSRDGGATARRATSVVLALVGLAALLGVPARAQARPQRRAVVHGRDGRPIHSRALAAKAPYPRMYRVGTNGFEPTLGITRGGWVLYSGGDPRGMSPGPWISKDQGKTWTDASPRIGPLSRRPFCCLDPYFYVDPRTSRAFKVDFIGCSQLSFSDDAGTNWTETAVCGHVDNEKLFAGPPVFSPTIGYPNVVYYCAINGGEALNSTATTCSKSLDGGLTFVPTGSPAFLDDPTQGQIPDSCNGAVGRGAVGPDGTVYVAKDWCGDPYLAISRDEGATWERVRIAHNGIVPPVEAGVAVDSRGTVYYTWVAGRPYLAISQDRGRTWSRPMMIGPPGLVGSAKPAIDVGAPGKIAVAYMGLDSNGWGGYITMSSNVLTRDPIFYSASVNDPRHPLVGDCQFMNICGGAGDFFDVKIGPDGTPWAALVDVAGCAGNPNSCNNGVVGRLVGGPSLR